MRKPVIALVDGICFGGGAGLAMNSSVRVVTERAVRPALLRPPARRWQALTLNPPAPATALRDAGERDRFLP